MPIQINRNSGIPLYLQLKNQIIKEISSGELKLGDRMATERELASEINVSRKTVSHTYNVLEQEGVLISHQGKGTFVADDTTGWKTFTDKESVLKLVDLAIESAFERDIPTADFLDIVRARVQEKEAYLSETQAIFVECNIEQARSFADQLSEKTHFKLLPVTVAELAEMSMSTKHALEKAKVVVPTFNHVNEVIEILKKHGIKKKVMGVAISPDLETIVKIAKYPEDTQFGLACLSEEFFYKVAMALKTAGLHNLRLKHTKSRDRNALVRFLQDVDVAIVSPGRLKEITEIVGEDKDVIRFDYHLDDSTVKPIISRLVENR
ncbi:GntR family transcriptional regulator [Clostridia bacterium]|nr:GntR family transcriptional regulator [Clostridia bacterium]